MHTSSTGFIRCGGRCWAAIFCLDTVFLGIRDDAVSSGTCPRPPRGRVERSSSAVETSPWVCQERSNPLFPWRSLHSVPTGVGTPVETTCWSVGGCCLLWGVPCSVRSASPARPLVVSSGAKAQPRHPHGPAGSVRGCGIRGDVSTSALHRRASGRHDVRFRGGVPSHPIPVLSSKARGRSRVGAPIAPNKKSPEGLWARRL